MPIIARTTALRSTRTRISTNRDLTRKPAGRRLHNLDSKDDYGEKPMMKVQDDTEG
jgi:hypothetical protein